MSGVTSAIAPNSIKNSHLADESKQVGVNQSWQNVTASRAFSVTYTNTTGRPILIAVNLYNGSGVTLGLTVDGNLVGTCYQPGVANGYAQITAIVPSGSAYSLTGNTLNSWFELR